MISTQVMLVWLGVAFLGMALFSWMKRRQERLDPRPQVDWAELVTVAAKALDRPNATICNTSYIDRSVMLGDTDFKYCQFIRCNLIDDGPWSMASCFMDSCTLQSANVAKSQEFVERGGERRHSTRRMSGLLTTPGDQD